MDAEVEYAGKAVENSGTTLAICCQVGTFTLVHVMTWLPLHLHPLLLSESSFACTCFMHQSGADGVRRMVSSSLLRSSCQIPRDPLN